MRAAAVLAAAAGAGLVLLAASRPWRVVVETMPAPLPDRVTSHTGGDLVPALPALALVALAGAGGLLAARGRARTVVAVLITLAGAGIVALAAAHLGEHPAWPVLSLFGGVVVLAAGALAVLRGRDWPALGKRFERRTGEATGITGDVWDAIERGEDPTKN